jgi:hypothetical protein
MNYYVSISLTNTKSSVHLHALYSPCTALRTFKLCMDQVVICGQYRTRTFIAVFTKACHRSLSSAL